MQVHAAKTGHTSFSESTEEIKPLTAEEKAKQMELYVWELCALYVYHFLLRSYALYMVTITILCYVKYFVLLYLVTL